MAIPAFNTQTPSDSILDINGRQTYLGNTFIVPSPGISLADTNEDIICVIQNPAGSGKSLFIFTRNVLTNTNTVLFKYYLNPTVNVPGTATAAINLRTGSALVSITRCYLAASITSNGTFLTALTGSTNGFTSKTLLIIDPGATLLITGKASSATTIAIAETVWYEI